MCRRSRTTGSSLASRSSSRRHRLRARQRDPDLHPGRPAAITEFVEGEHRATVLYWRLDESRRLRAGSRGRSTSSDAHAAHPDHAGDSPASTISATTPSGSASNSSNRSAGTIGVAVRLGLRQLARPRTVTDDERERLLRHAPRALAAPRRDRLLGFLAACSPRTVPVTTTVLPSSVWGVAARCSAASRPPPPGSPKLSPAVAQALDERLIRPAGRTRAERSTRSRRRPRRRRPMLVDRLRP